MTLRGVLALASVSFVAERNVHNLANGTGRIAASHAVYRVESKSVISFNIIRDYLNSFKTDSSSSKLRGQATIVPFASMTISSG